MITTAPQDIARQDAASFEVYRRLRNDIVTCKLKPHDRLRFDSLRAEYNAGVGTLREALSHLVSDGLVRTEAGKGYYVAPVSAKDLIDITDWRVEFESRALTLSIKNGDERWEANIVSGFHLLTRASQIPGKPSPAALADFGEKHRAFHDCLVAACGSPWLLYFRGVLFDQALRYQALAVLSQGRSKHKPENDHKALMEAALKRDAKAATRVMEQHIRGTTEVVLRSLPSVAETERTPTRQRRRAARS